MTKKRKKIKQIDRRTNSKFIKPVVSKT